MTAFAWGEVDITFPSPYRPLIAQLKELRAVVDLPCQLVHGDLGGNILFHPQEPPAVIDLSPFWRPKRYADAILVVDAIAWAGQNIDALEPLRDADGVQMTYRAILFRLGAAAIILDGHDERHLPRHPGSLPMRSANPDRPKRDQDGHTHHRAF